MEKKKTTQTVSAGGVVVRRIGSKVELLLINDKKYNDWMLPKGHTESGETLEETALREIREETGVDKCRVVEKLGSYTRFKEEANEEKTVHVFLIVAPSDGSKLQPEYDYMRVKWFPLNKLPSIYLPNEEKLISENVELILRTV